MCKSPSSDAFASVVTVAHSLETLWKRFYGNSIHRFERGRFHMNNYQFSPFDNLFHFMPMFFSDGFLRLSWWMSGATGTGIFD